MKWTCIQRNWHHFAVSGNQKNVRQSYTNSVFFSPNNEKQAIQAKQDRLKRERYRAEHKASKRYIEVAMSDLHLNTANYIAPNPRQPICPAAADNPGWMRWSPEDGEGGLRRVLLPRPLVRRKATIKSTSAMRYSSWKKAKQTTKAKRRFLIIKQASKPNRSLLSRLQVKKADCKSKPPPMTFPTKLYRARWYNFVPKSLAKRCRIVL